MSLPLGKDKESKISLGEKNRLKEEARIAAEKAKQESDKKRKAKEEFNKHVNALITRIESDIIYAINKGMREANIRIYDNDLDGKGWNAAIANLRKNYGKEYTFNISEDSELCNNGGEAANVDGVSYCEWTEDFYNLKITW